VTFRPFTGLPDVLLNLVFARTTVPRLGVRFDNVVFTPLVPPASLGDGKYEVESLSVTPLVNERESTLRSCIIVAGPMFCHQ